VKTDEQMYDDMMNRQIALQQAVAIHAVTKNPHGVLATAREYLAWLRRPNVPAKLKLSIGPVKDK
jgi:hypothetical protein